MRAFYRDYGVHIGGASVSQDMSKRYRKSKDMATLSEALFNLEKSTGENFETLDGQLLKNNQTMSKLMTKDVLNIFVPHLDTIGKLQILRKMVV